MSGRFSATVCVPLHETGRVDIAVDIPDLGALSGEAGSLVFSLLDRCVQFALDVDPPGPVTFGEQKWITGTLDTSPLVMNAAPDIAHEPVACPVVPCSFVAKGETGLRTHLSGTHKLRGAGRAAVAERNRLLDQAMGRDAEREPIEKPPAIDGPVTRRADAMNDGTTRIVTVPTPPPVVPPRPSAPTVNWPEEPPAKVQFDPDAARRRAAEAL